MKFQPIAVYVANTITFAFANGEQLKRREPVFRMAAFTPTYPNDVSLFGRPGCSLNQETCDNGICCPISACCQGGCCASGDTCDPDPAHPNEPCVCFGGCVSIGRTSLGTVLATASRSSSVSPSASGSSTSKGGAADGVYTAKLGWTGICGIVAAGGIAFGALAF